MLKEFHEGALGRIPDILIKEILIEGISEGTLGGIHGNYSEETPVGNAEGTPGAIFAQTPGVIPEQTLVDIPEGIPRGTLV